MLVKALSSYDKTRERSLQQEIGVSQLGGCRRQVWFQLKNYEKSNATLKLPALMGTAIHTMIEEALAMEANKTWSEYLIEVEVQYQNLKGHIDLYIPTIGAVVDWKTTTKSNMRYFPSEQQRWQVHTYAYLLKKSGHEPKTVTLVAIPRDGNETQIKIHSEEYDEQVALDAWNWYQDLLQREEAPEPERSAKMFCQSYCPYFGDNCQGKQ